jgi:putative ABC transport system permease protein
MWSLAWANVRSNLGRLLATVVAIVAGVSFLAAGLMFTSSIDAALGENAANRYPSVVAQIRDSVNRQAAPAKLPATLVEQAAGLSTVAAVKPELTGSARVYRPGRTKPEGISARLIVADSPLEPMQVSSGRLPAAGGEMTLDRKHASDFNLKVGDDVRIVTATGERTMHLVGTTKWGNDDAPDLNGTAGFGPADAFDVLNGGQQVVDRVIVSAKAGVSNAEVEAALRTIAPPGSSVTNRTVFLADVQGGLGGLSKLLRPVLTGFSLLALFICAFVISNTFAVVVAQRVRELALLRAVAATPRQVRWSLRSEALLVGLVGSVLGVAVGAGLATAAAAILRAFDIELPGAGARLEPLQILICVVVGTLVTVLAVFRASRRAARVAPVEAMRSGALETRIKGRSVWWLVPFGVGVVGVLVGGYGMVGWLLGLGALVFLVSLLFCGPLLAHGTAWVAGRLLGRSPTARLAAANLDRNPRRTAATANALIIGVMLIALVTTAGSTLRTSLVKTMSNLSTADIFLIVQPGTAAPEAALQKIRTTAGVVAFSTFTTAPAEVGTINAAVTGADPASIERAAGLQTVSGSLDQLGPGKIAVLDYSGIGGGGAPGTAARVGQTVSVHTLAGKQADLTVVATIKFSLDTLFLQNLVDPSEFRELFGDLPAAGAFIAADQGQATRLFQTLEPINDEYSNIQLLQGNFLAQVVGNILNVLISGVNGLLGMSVFIAVIGIINTMILSILERRREIGLLRAVGMTPGGARRMVLTEALVIAVFGTLVGLGAGVFLGFGTTRALQGDSTGSVGDSGRLAFELAPGRLGIIVAVGIVVGLIAAVIPMIRVSRMNVLDALGD